jgi:hypothetical protein
MNYERRYCHDPWFYACKFTAKVKISCSLESYALATSIDGEGLTGSKLLRLTCCLPGLSSKL